MSRAHTRLGEIESRPSTRAQARPRTEPIPEEPEAEANAAAQGETGSQGEVESGPQDGKCDPTPLGLPEPTGCIGWEAGEELVREIVKVRPFRSGPDAMSLSGD
jgi:hypothetical protein